MTTKMLVLVNKTSTGCPRKLIDERGNRYGRLLVRELVSENYGSRRGASWWCDCDCGNRIPARGIMLRAKHTKSCGCVNRERLSARRLPEGEAAFNIVYRKVQGGATKRNLVWELTKDQVRQLVTAPCHYCGIAPVRCVTRWTGNFSWNGVDRKDSRLGYTVKNCVTACSSCNSMKCSIPYEDFVARIKRMAATLRGN